MSLGNKEGMLGAILKKDRASGRSCRSSLQFAPWSGSPPLSSSLPLVGQGNIQGRHGPGPSRRYRIMDVD